MLKEDNVPGGLRLSSEEPLWHHDDVFKLNQRLEGDFDRALLATDRNAFVDVFAALSVTPPATVMAFCTGIPFSYYTAIYSLPRGALWAEVIGWLRFGHVTRRPRARGKDRRGRIPDLVSMHDRPPDVEERLIPGHWEGDLIKRAQNRSPVGTLVERTTLHGAGQNRQRPC